MKTLAETMGTDVSKELAVVEIENKPDRVREFLKNVSDAEGKLDIIAGELLFEVRENQWFKTYGYASFDEYLDKEVSFRRRKSYYLMRIYEKFVKELAIPVKVLRCAEWSKVKELVGVVTKENWAPLLEKTKTMSVPQTVEMVRGLKPKVVATKTGEAEPVVKLSFGLYPDQAVNVRHALEIAAKEANSNSQGHLLDLICVDFVAGHAAAGDALTDTASRLARIVNSLETTFGVKITISKGETK